MRYDVIEVTMSTNRVKVISRNRTLAEAERTERKFIALSGVRREFFAVVKHGTYNNGDAWDFRHVQTGQ